MSDILLTEKVSDLRDEKKFENKKPKCYYHTDVECRNELGELLFKKSNVILMGGRRFTLEKLFNIRKNGKLTLNELLGVNQAEDEVVGDGPRREQAICLFGVGNGGSGITFGSTIDPKAKETNLYGLVPMRYVDATNDLDGDTKNKYYMRKEMPNGKIAYYLKKFETDPVIYMRYGDVDYAPNPEDNIPTTNSTNIITSDEVDTYVEISLKISAEDVREWFNESGELEVAYINELALYFGYQDSKPTEETWADYLGVEAFSKLTFNNEPLDDESKELNIIYRIYI